MALCPTLLIAPRPSYWDITSKILCFLKGLSAKPIIIKNHFQMLAMLTHKET